MTTDIGPRIGIDGAAEFNRSLKNIISQSKSLAAEMKAVTSAFDSNDSSQKKLQSQMNVLSKQIENQQQRVKLLGDNYTASAKKVDDLNAELVKAIQEFGQTSTQAQKAAQALDRQEQATQRAKTEYLNATTALNRMQSQMGELSSKVNQVRTPLERLNDTINSQENDLQSLKNQYANAVLEFGKGSNSAKRLQGEIEELSNDLRTNKQRLADVTGQVDDLGDRFNTAGQQAADFGDVLAGSFLGNVLADAVSELGSALAGFTGDAISAADSLAKFESTMDFAGFDSKTIQETEAAMQDYAARTVYDLETVSNTVAQLGANGVDNFEALTEAAGNLNAVAGGNADTFSSVAMVLTQTAGAGKLTTENWNQLTDAIPGASGVLQQAMLDAGAYTGNFREAMEDGEISAEEFNAAIMELGNSDAAKQAATSVSTVEGAVGNLEATITDMITSFTADGGTEMIAGFINSLTDGFQQLGDWVSANKDQIMDFAQNAFTGIMDFGQFIVDNWQVIVDAIAAIAAGMAAAKFAKFVTDISSAISAATNLSTAISGISAVAPGLGSALSLLTNPVFLVAGAITALIGVVAIFGDDIQAVLQQVDDFLQNIFAVDFTNIFGPVLGDVVNGFMATVKSAWDSIQSIFSGVIDFIRGVFTGDWQRAWQGVSDIFSGIVNGLVTIFKAPVNGIISIFNGLVSAINLVIDGLNSIHIDIPDWVPGIGGGTLGFNIPHFGKAPYLATGGIVRSGSAIVGEAGPELMTVLGNRTIVQPLTGRYAVKAADENSGSRPAPVINITVNGAPGQDENVLAEIIMQKIQAATARKGAVWG